TGAAAEKHRLSLHHELDGLAHGPQPAFLLQGTEAVSFRGLTILGRELGERGIDLRFVRPIVCCCIERDEIDAMSFTSTHEDKSLFVTLSPPFQPFYRGTPAGCTSTAPMSTVPPTTRASRADRWWRPPGPWRCCRH